MKTELFWVQGPWFGQLAIMPRPRGGDWLGDELRSWRQAGIDLVVSLLTSEEIADLGLLDEDELCKVKGMTFLSFPIVDRGVPRSKIAASEFLATLVNSLSDGKNIAIHCRQGIGRAGLIAICLLVQAGVQPDAAIRTVSTARGFPVPETLDQQKWIVDFAKAPVGIVA